MSKKVLGTPMPKVGGGMVIGHVKGSVPRMENPPPPPPPKPTPPSDKTK